MRAEWVYGLRGGISNSVIKSAVKGKSVGLCKDVHGVRQGLAKGKGGVKSGKVKKLYQEKCQEGEDQEIQCVSMREWKG